MEQLILAYEDVLKTLALTRVVSSNLTCSSYAPLTQWTEYDTSNIEVVSSSLTGSASGSEI